MTDQPLDILCLSHLAWERKLFQRPQQLMSRFEKMGHRVGYLGLLSSRRHKTEPELRATCFGERGRADAVPFVPLSGRIRLCRDLTVRRAIRRGRRMLGDSSPDRRVLWLEHPAFLPALRSVPHALSIYDCMDPHFAFRKSAPDVAEQEVELLRRAGLVFAGGRSLHRHCLEHNPSAVCFPSGIDFEHFSRAAEPGPVPEEMERLPRPRLLYFGAVDERIDWEIVSALCRSHPEWAVVFVGPLVTLDRCPIEAGNFHHLGPREYEHLPSYLRGADVCLIPWVVNQLTGSMSPTKTPEYLAGGRPVVSTPIPDVREDYGHDVLLGGHPEDYVRACEKAVRSGTGPPLKPESARSWSELAEAMNAMIMGRLG